MIVHVLTHTQLAASSTLIVQFVATFVFSLFLKGKILFFFVQCGSYF